MMDNFRTNDPYPKQGLYDPRFEHDACGIGAVVNMKGIPSRRVVEDALQIVETLEHRAGKDAEGKTGDGVGILLQISHTFFTQEAEKLNITLGEARDYGVGMFFFPQDELKRRQAKKLFEIITQKEGMEVLGWREVPTVPEILGDMAFNSMPSIWQAFVKRPESCEKGLPFDRMLYIARRVFEQSNENTYVVSLSSRTIVYKGMFLVKELRQFFPDLQSPAYESAIATVHSRFSTNTTPSWQKAHPNRYIVHNGEINTITGNADKMLAREESIDCAILKEQMHKLLPIIDTSGSDSARLDNTLEFLVMSGMPLPKAVMLLIPEPWKHNRAMSRNKKDFYQYYATMMEPWDGPASILFSDGDVMGAVLDRNGLRPSRYYITDDGFLILSSEVGALDLDAAHILHKDRLKPGKMLLVDTTQGRLIDDEELKEYYACQQPYGEWLDMNLVRLRQLHIPNRHIDYYPHEKLTQMQKAFGYTYEEIRNSILPMAENGSEPIASMGADNPLPSLSEQNPPLFDYFRQLFAQVTNPPFDAIREEIVTNTSVYIGSDGNLLEEKASNCHVLRVDNPILTNTDMLKIKHMNIPGMKVQIIPITYYKNTSLKNAIRQLFIRADKAYRDGANFLILSDRDVDEFHVAIPSLLAVSALQQHLVATRKRTAMALILETAEPREVHHFATLLGYGASAINPYLAHETIRELTESGALDKDYYAAEADYDSCILHGIVKIASKMGISTIQSYQGSKLFEAVGVSQEVIDEYFTGTVSRVGGITLKEIEQRVDALHSSAFDPLELGVENEVSSIGTHKMRNPHEEHLYRPETIHLLQKASRTGNYEVYKKYAESVHQEGRNMQLRDMLNFNYPETGISIEEVEPVESILKRFKTGAMSYGSISQEAHETLALAMNRIGGKSNSGEGGESPERIATAGTEHDSSSAIKQVASGRFGVTSEYLVSAKELQIKCAQGAKPGEGGHLPAGKVYPWIAKTRHSTPGVGLISPPPHHDIYSIEDLAQLIYDLKMSNVNARISVKLVSEAGVGTVAAGVAKAGAGVVLISGYDGGTGAAPATSIHHAGLPWELGVAETHQTLLLNNLRSRVVVETDGKLMTGRDVLVAALLGAEEYGFATAPLVTMGCMMMRVCNLDTCPVGIATQNPELRKRFTGKPEYVINFLTFVAEELREYMAKLGIRTVDELIGRTDLLCIKDEPEQSRAHLMNLSALMHKQENAHFQSEDAYDFHLEETLDEKVLLKKLPLNGHKKQITVHVTNTDRTFGTMFGSAITRKFGTSLEEDTYHVKCIGSGGQSFGAFIPKGLTLELCGDSNDYFGKGLSGGQLIVYPPENAAFKAEENIIIGNVALYGATSGKVFINGIAGERFAVRNSGALAVVEGVGDHGCEYMTGGRVVVLGKTGKNFAAGMSGGIAYVLDENRDLYMRLNKELVSLEEVKEKYDVLELKTLIEEHAQATGSEKAKRILENFSEYLPKFKRIMPHDYAKMRQAILSMEEKGMRTEEAEIEAFYLTVR